MLKGQSSLYRLLGRPEAGKKSRGKTNKDPDEERKDQSGDHSFLANLPATWIYSLRKLVLFAFRSHVSLCTGIGIVEISHSG